MDDRVWKALAEPKRRNILDLLKSEPMTTGDICKQIPEIDRCTVMKHLDILTDAGLVLIERRGRERFNFLNPAPLHEIVERWVTGHTARMAMTARSIKYFSENQDTK